VQLTSNRKLRTTRDELQEIAAVLVSELIHDLQKIADASAVQVEAVVCLDRIHESCKQVSYGH
jgi:hypothetical protein